MCPIATSVLVAALRTNHRPGRREIESLVAQLQALLGAGVPAGEAVDVAARTRGPVGRLASQLAPCLRRGQGLASALARVDAPLSAAELALVAAGEASGRSARALGLLRIRLAERARARGDLLRAATYPVLLLSITLAVVAAMAVFVLPTFASLYTSAGVELPASTRALLALGQALTGYAPSVGVVLLLGVAATVAAWKRWLAVRVALDRAVLGLPLVGTIVRSGEKRNLYATLAALLAAGTDLERALTLSTPAITNTQLAESARRLSRAVRRGTTLSRALERSGFDPAGGDTAILRLAEATGDYGAAFEHAASAAAGRREECLKRLTALAEPAAQLIMALAVGLTVLSLYQPVLGSAALLGGELR